MQKRLFIGLVIVVLVAVCITGSLTTSLLSINCIKDIEDKLITSSKLIVSYIDEFEEIPKYHDLATKFAKETESRITFINENGLVLGDSEIDAKGANNHLNRPEVKDALEGKIATAKRYSISTMTERFYVAVPFQEDDKLVVLRISVPITYTNRYKNDSLLYIMISVTFGTLVAILLGYRYVCSITKPIKELTSATQSIAMGKFGEKVTYSSNDEIGDLAKSFDLMRKKLYDNIQELEENNTKTKAILTSMVNGIIAVNNNLNITFINTTAEEMFLLEEKEVKDKPILDQIENEELRNKLEEMLMTKGMSKSEIELNNPYRVLNIHCNNIVLNKDATRKIGILVSFQDVTEIRKLETMRKDFVANVSHELKTPLTSIQGFIETLKNNDVKDEKLKSRFLNIIDIEAKRLTNLVKDLLVLSDIENKHRMYQEDDIEVRECILEIIGMFEKIAQEKNIEIVEKISGKLHPLKGNASWFKQMIINLVDNSIKYTPSGGKIQIIGYSVDKKLHIKVKDSGIGIPPEHVSRLFERFYRVDKARSRKIGGTGLGLAIVKHIIIAFKGEIKVRSKVDKGTEFEVIIPENNEFYK